MSQKFLNRLQTRQKGEKGGYLNSLISIIYHEIDSFCQIPQATGGFVRSIVETVPCLGLGEG